MEKASCVELRKYAKLCAKSLADDAEICQQVEQELFAHLEDAFAEEREKSSEENACKNAMRRFGNPEELSSQLAEGNAKRLSRHAKMRRVVKWLALPLLVVGVLLCLDRRSILSSVTLLKWILHSSNLHMDLGLTTRTLTDDEQMLFDYYFHKHRPDEEIHHLAHLYDFHRDNAMLCAIYALELASRKSTFSEQLPEVLANGRRIDAGNPLYDYLECSVLLRESCKLPGKNEKPTPDAVQNRRKLDEAMALYRRALSKGPVRTYGGELKERIRGMLKIEEDLLGGMHLMELAASERLHLPTLCRTVTKGVLLYCDLLHKEGENAKARELLGTWRTFLPQFVGRDGVCLVEVIGAMRQAELFLQCARRINAIDEIPTLQAVTGLDKEMQASIYRDLSHLRAGGLLSAFVPPNFRGLDNLDEWKVERRLEAAAFDAMSLGLACLLLLVAMAFLGLQALRLRLGGRNPFLFLLPASVYARLFLRGILLPALAYPVLAYFIAGRGGLPIVQQVVPIAWLCLLWPAFYGFCCHNALKTWMRSIGAEAQDAFRASLSLNLLVLLAVLLLFHGCILRPIADWRQRHYARLETLVLPRPGIQTLEQRIIQNWQTRFLQRCQ